MIDKDIVILEVIKFIESEIDRTEQKADKLNLLLTKLQALEVQEPEESF